jgi:hypothetical protein
MKKPNYNSAGIERLMIGVLKQAIRDAKKGDEQAQGFVRLYMKRRFNIELPDNWCKIKPSKGKRKKKDDNEISPAWDDWES